MQLFKISFYVFLICLFTNSSWAESFNTVLAKLDSNYYYPQNQGLDSLSARVQWEQLDVASGSGKFLRNPDLIFSWKKMEGGGQGDFKLADGQEHRSSEYVRQVMPFREAIIPLTLNQKFLNYKGQVEQADGNNLVVKLDPDYGSGRHYKFLVDSKKWVIKKLRFGHTSSSDTGEFRYLKLDDKRAISESQSRFTIKDQKYSENTRYSYKQVGGIWLVHRIDQTIELEGEVMQTYILKLSQFRPVLSSGR